MNYPDTEQEIGDRVRGYRVPEAFLPADEALVREAAEDAREPLHVLESE